MSTCNITSRVPTELRDRIAAAAKISHVSMADWVREACEERLAGATTKKVEYSIEFKPLDPANHRPMINWRNCCITDFGREAIRRIDGNPAWAGLSWEEKHARLSALKNGGNVA